MYSKNDFKHNNIDNYDVELEYKLLEENSSSYRGFKKSFKIDRLLILWLFASSLGGWFLSLFLNAPDFMSSLKYQYCTDNYSAFCYGVIVSIVSIFYCYKKIVVMCTLDAQYLLYTQNKNKSIMQVTMHLIMQKIFN